MDLATKSEWSELLRYLTSQEIAELEILIESDLFATVPFEDFCERFLKIQDKRGQIVPLVVNDVQHELISNLSGMDIVLKSRQVGISTIIQAWLFFNQMRGNCRTSTLCHEDELTTTLRSMSDRFYEELSDNLKREYPRRYANAKLTMYSKINSEGSIVTVGGPSGAKKGRGSSVSIIHGSEVAFWSNAESVMAAAMQAGEPSIILESTPNGAVGWFYERCMDALDGNGIFKLHFFPWWMESTYRLELEEGETLEPFTEEEQRLIAEHGLTIEQIKWRRFKMIELPKTFLQEYPEDPKSCFLLSGRSFFGNVDEHFTASLNPQYNPKHRYVGGLDFAQANDFTCLVILDATASVQVDQLRINKTEWQEMRRQISAMARKWNAKVIGEGNSMGTTNAELLQSGEILRDGTIVEAIDLDVFFTTPASKPPLIQGLYHALNEGGLRLLPNEDMKHEIRSFVSRQLPSGHWVYEAGGGAHDDLVMAAALAWYGVNNSSGVLFA